MIFIMKDGSILQIYFFKKIYVFSLLPPLPVNEFASRLDVVSKKRIPVVMYSQNPLILQLGMIFYRAFILID
jgi:hypothetical protein